MISEDLKKRERVIEKLVNGEFKSDLEIIAYELYGDEIEEKIQLPQPIEVVDCELFLQSAGWIA